MRVDTTLQDWDKKLARRRHSLSRRCDSYTERRMMNVGREVKPIEQDRTTVLNRQMTDQEEVELW